jgi:hypothetical protein
MVSALIEQETLVQGCMTLRNQLGGLAPGKYWYVNGMGKIYTSDSQPGFRGTLGYREHFLWVPRDVEIKINK